MISEKYIKIVIVLLFFLVEILVVFINIEKCFLSNIGYEGLVLLSNDNIIVRLGGSEVEIFVSKM